MRKGFTLIELIVVIAIIAILAAIIAPNAFKAIEKARVSGTCGDYRSIKTAAMSYYADVGDWPANNNTTNFTADDGASGWDGPYLERWPARNPWSGNYLWREDTAGTFGTGSTERYIVVDSVPTGSANRVDENLDDGANNTGDVRHSGLDPATLWMHISDDQY